jgi:hypothetical protein
MKKHIDIPRRYYTLKTKVKKTLNQMQEKKMKDTKHLIGKPGFGIFYHSFDPENGPCSSDGVDLIDWVETKAEAEEVIEEANSGCRFIHYTYEAMNRPEMLPMEEYEAAMREVEAMRQKVETGEITEKQFYDWMYGEEEQDITKRPTVLGDLATCDCGL